jgi:putative hydrolase of the HAD superfamily
MASSTSIKSVLFDMDETLLIHARDFRELTADLFAQFEDRLGGIDYQRFAKTLWPKAVDMWFMMYDGVLPGAVARRYTITNTLRQLEADLELTEALMAAWDELFVTNTSLMPDADTVLAELRSAGIRLGIVTNGYSEVQHSKIRHHGLEPKVDFVLVSEDAGSHKPDRGIFEKALEHAGTAPHETVFVGDTPHTDIEGARAIGMIPVLIDPKGSHDENLPDHQTPHHRIKELSELLALVNNSIEKTA